MNYILVDEYTTARSEAVSTVLEAEESSFSSSREDLIRLVVKDKKLRVT